MALGRSQFNQEKGPDIPLGIAVGITTAAAAAAVAIIAAGVAATAATAGAVAAAVRHLGDYEDGRVETVSRCSEAVGVRALLI